MTTVSGDAALTRLNARLEARGGSLAIVPLAAALAVSAIVVVNAWGGLMPGIGFWDTGEFQTVLPILGTAHPTGYPTYVLLGFVANVLLTPVGEPAFRITVISLLAIAGAAGLTVELVRRLTASLALGVAAGLGLALTPVVWQNATRADPHPLHLFFVALILVLLVGWEQARRRARAEIGGERRPAHPDRWLVAATVAFGLSAGNHSLTLLLVPPIGLYVLTVEPGIVRRPRFVLTCAAALLITLVAVYLELPIRAGLLPAPLVYARPDTWDGFWYIALAEQFRSSLSHPFDDLAGKAGDLWTMALTQFGALALLIPPGFVATIRRAPRYALLSGLAMGITVVFNAAYSNADINRYYLGPILWAWTWIGCFGLYVADGLAIAWAFVTRRRLETLRLAWGVTALVVAVALLVPAAADLTARRQGADRHLDPGASAWLEDVLPKLQPNAVVVSWWSTSTPLWYSKYVDGRRTDIDVVDDRTILDRNYGSAVGAISRFFGTRPVYIIRANDQDLGLVRAAYQLTLVTGSGSLAVYQVTGTAGGTG